MKGLVVLLFASMWPSAAAAVSEPPAVAVCQPNELLGYAPSRDEVEAHRQAALPNVEYSKGDGPGHLWGFEIVLRIDDAGRVHCYQLKSDFGEPVHLNFERRAWLQGLVHLRYQPFLDGDAPRAAIVTESVHEIERVAQSQPLPNVPLSQVSIGLERSACYGSCPSYKVTLRGDGTVTYVGNAFVDVKGEHHYQIPVAEVARLVDSLAAKDIWSAKDEYQAPITDNPTYTLKLTLGKHSRTIVDYVGEMVGMPPAISAFEREIDAAARSEQWINLSAEAVDLLDAEGFDFAGSAGSDLLWRAASNGEGKDDRAIVKLLEHGVRADVGPPADQFVDPNASLLDVALRNHHGSAAAALIAAHALETAGQLDQAKVDNAFRAAIAGGRLAAAQQVWSAAGASARPALEFDDSDRDDGQASKRAPVTLLLNASYDDHHWEGLALAQWLASLGCDLKASGADGRTLLHIAANAKDAALVRYLLDQGLDPNTPGRFGLPALGSADSEEVAMLLLEAGTDISKLGADSRFRDYARGNHWLRVTSWLDSHPQQ